MIYIYIYILRQITRMTQFVLKRIAPLSVTIYLSSIAIFSLSQFHHFFFFFVRDRALCLRISCTWRLFIQRVLILLIKESIYIYKDKYIYSIRQNASNLCVHVMCLKHGDRAVGITCDRYFEWMLYDNKK